MLGFLILGGLFSSEGVRRYMGRYKELKNLQAQLKQAKSLLGQKNAKLDRALGDPEFLEKQARKELGLIKMDEMEFRFSPSLTDESNQPNEEHMLLIDD